MVDAYVTQAHHLPHVAPIIHALPEQLRGRLYVGFGHDMPTAAARYGLDATLGHPSPSDRPVLVASGNELPVVERAILVEHGVGQTYEGISHVCWPGGDSRDNVALFVVPNETVAEKNRARYPNTPNAVVGSPHVEALRALPPYPLAEPRIAISSHWDCGNLVDEMRSGFAWFENTYEQLCRERPDAFVLHGHPRMQDYTEWKSREWGVEFCSDFAELTQRAWLLIHDNSSTLFEWAALGRPVVVVSPPWYREDCNHGLRFNEYRDVGIHVRDPDELEAAMYLALADLGPQRERRQVISAFLFGSDVSQGASMRAAQAIEQVVA